MTRSADIQALFQHGKRIERPALIVLWRETCGARRVGFAVTRQIRGSVRRNRARRRLREAYRYARAVAPAQVDLVVIAKRDALDRAFDAVVGQLRDALGLARASSGSA